VEKHVLPVERDVQLKHLNDLCHQLVKKVVSIVIAKNHERSVALLVILLVYAYLTKRNE